jgi:hypothetical protein
MAALIPGVLAIAPKARGDGDPEYTGQVVGLTKAGNNGFRPLVEC